MYDVLIEFAIKAVIIDFQHAYNQVKLVVEHTTDRTHSMRFYFLEIYNGSFVNIQHIYTCVSGSHIVDKDHYDVT